MPRLQGGVAAHAGQVAPPTRGVAAHAGQVAPPMECSGILYTCAPLGFLIYGELAFLFYGKNYLRFDDRRSRLGLYQMNFRTGSMASRRVGLVCIRYM